MLARLDHMLTHAAGNGKAKPADPYADTAAGRYFLTLAFRRIRERFAALDDNDDAGLLGVREEHDREVLMVLPRRASVSLARETCKRDACTTKPSGNASQLWTTMRLGLPNTAKSMIGKF